MATATSSGSASLDAFAPGRQQLDDLVEEVAGPLSVLGGNLDHRLETQPIELERAIPGPLVVGLVDRNQHRHVRRSQAAGDLLVGRQQSVPAIHNKDNDIGRLERFLALDDDQLVQRIVARPEKPPGIDEGERGAQPLGGMGIRVAGRPRYGGDDGAPGAGNSVKQG